MKVTQLPDGGVITEPETEHERRIHEAGVTACLHEIAMERADIDEHRATGADPGDFRDLGLSEAYDRMDGMAKALGEQLDDDAINAVCCDKRVEAALNEFYAALTKEA